MSDRNGVMGMGAGGHQRSVLLTLGRLPVSLELARAFAAAGWRVVVLDSISWHLCRASKAVHKCIKVPSPKAHPEGYKKTILTIVLNEGIELVVPISEEGVYIASLSDSLPESVKLLSVQQAEWIRLHDKWQCMTFLHNAGLSVPHTETLSTALSSSTKATKRCVLKKRLTAAGSGLQILDIGQSYPAVNNAEDWIVQPLLSGPELCVFSVFHDGALQLRVGYAGILMDGSVSVAFERIELPLDVVQWLIRFGEVTQYTGMASFDFMQNDDSKWCALECNPRATSGIHFIDPEQLAIGMTRPGNASMQSDLIYKLGKHRMEFWSSFTLCFSQRGRATASQTQGTTGLKPILRVLKTNVDVTWSKADPMPFLTMPLVNIPLLWRSFRQRKTLAECVIADINWPPNADTDADTDADADV